MVFEDKIKELGSWDLFDSTELDDYAYYLYCTEYYFICEKTSQNYLTSLITQSFFKKLYWVEKKNDMKFYQDAILILRKEKIEYIINKIKERKSN